MYNGCDNGGRERGGYVRMLCVCAHNDIVVIATVTSYGVYQSSDPATRIKKQKKRNYMNGR